ncbi:YihY/virulence factor BrkB family protein [Larkinella soli]|uniref:YihY/virulence factor BrkB family protein n=1 Tax=Larkinella soli TaxID=1770527 RepID=UPI00286E041F|nr:YihY/virulence factor BrkB family protein [Larkinella soli]
METIGRFGPLSVGAVYPRYLNGFRMWERIERISWVQNLIQYLKTHRALDSKQSWFEFLQRFLPKISDPDTSERSASVSYSLLLAVFPFTIFLFTLIPYIPIPDLENQIMDFLSKVLPASTYDTVKTTIYDIISRPRSGILSFGFVLALYAATNGILSLMMAFNVADRLGEGRSFIQTRLIAFGLTLMLAVSLFLAVAILVIGGVITDYLQQIRILDNAFVTSLLHFSRYFVVFVVFVAVIAVIYRYGPAVKMKWRFITPGCIAASVLIVLTTYGFSYYVSNFASYNKLYGSIGTLIVLMVWINLVSLLLILGFDMNIALYNLEGERNPKVHEKTINAPQTV